MGNPPVVIRRPRQPSPQSEIEKILIRLISGINYGKITLVIQDSEITRIDREESVKLMQESS